MTSIIDEIIAEEGERYRIMSLLQLLEEENMIAAFSHMGGLDKIRKSLLAIVRSEIERKLQ